MNRPAPAAAWVAALLAKADQPPATPRVPLWSGDALIGSVERDYLGRLHLDVGVVQEAERSGQAGWEVKGELTQSLHAIALAMRDGGLAHAWRDEQLAIHDEQGRHLGTVERAAVRPLGITTFAVHLVGMSPDGRHWVQQRSLTKANDPGLWDTLVGGMVPASDSFGEALERETWEEAGLRMDQLLGLRHCGRVSTSRPSRDVQAGYVREHIDWYRCTLPEGLQPENQDGEVDQFRLMPGAEVAQRLERDEFTVEAALILIEAGL